MPAANTDPGVRPLPALSDNYIWLIRHGQDAVVVDPGQAEPVLQALRSQGLRLRAILLTHHHGDHVNGVPGLSHLGDIPVYGPAGESLPRCDYRLVEGDRVRIPELALDMGVLDVPGHTAGHIAYHGPAAGCDSVLFCGDTLFAAGCGRLFEGTPEQMHASLAKLAALPAHTLVCCAHEYTLANLRWARAVDPDNATLRDWQAAAEHLRADGQPTLPTLLELELAVNPFLRTAQEPVVRAATAWAQRPLNRAVEVFAALRAWKNEFK